MYKYLNSVVEFYFDNSPLPQSGYVVEENASSVLVVVEHGEFHGQEFLVPIADIIDDSYEKYDVSDEKLYAWYDGE